MNDTLGHKGESAEVVPPWNVHGLHVSIREYDPWNTCLDVAPVLEEVKVSPYSLPGVMDRVQFLRTVLAEHASFQEINLHPHLQNLGILGAGNHVQALYIPWVLDS